MAKVIVNPSGQSAVTKNYQKEAFLKGITEVAFYKPAAGSITSLQSRGITTIQYKKNAGSFATAVFPITYVATDTITFTWTYSDINNLTGNLIIFGTDV